MEPQNHKLRLTDAEVVENLSGLTSPWARDAVMWASCRIEMQREGLSEKQAAMVARIAKLGVESGVIGTTVAHHTGCSCCGAEAPMVRNKSRSRYAPRMVRGRSIVGRAYFESRLRDKRGWHLGACKDCMEAMKPHIDRLGRRLEFAIRDWQERDAERAWKKVDHWTCGDCGHQFPEFSGRCPACGATDRTRRSYTLKPINGNKSAPVTRCPDLHRHREAW